MDKILLANPRGFCAGVDRAIEIVNQALSIYGPPIYVRHEVVHNRYVVEDLRARGAIFIEDLQDAPDDVILIFSAHGVPQAVVNEAKQRKLTVFDATCPLVTKVHMEVIRYARQGRDCILIGHEGHPEVEGTMGQYFSDKGGKIFLVEDVEQAKALTVPNPDNLAWVTQTTLSVEDTSTIVSTLKTRFPNIVGPRKDDICYATQNRQDAVRLLSAKSDAVIVVGSPNSSNSNRLKELAERQGIESWLVDQPEQIQENWLLNKKTVGVTAGASAPEILVKNVIARIQALSGGEVEELLGKPETTTFPLPKELKIKPAV